MDYLKLLNPRVAATGKSLRERILLKKMKMRNSYSNHFMENVFDFIIQAKNLFEILKIIIFV